MRSDKGTSLNGAGKDLGRVRQRPAAFTGASAKEGALSLISLFGRELVPYAVSACRKRHDPFRCARTKGQVLMEQVRLGRERQRPAAFTGASAKEGALSPISLFGRELVPYAVSACRKRHDPFRCARTKGQVLMEQVRLGRERQRPAAF